MKLERRLDSTLPVNTRLEADGGIEGAALVGANGGTKVEGSFGGTNVGKVERPLGTMPTIEVAPVDLGVAVGTAHHVRPLVGPEQVTGAMIELIDSARTELLVVMHAITSKHMAVHLEKRARDGLPVTIVRNDPHSKSGVPSQKIQHEIDLLESLRAAGCKVVIVPQELLALATNQASPHDHRKLIVADRKRAYVGGSNPRTETDNFDTGFVVTGPCAQILARKVAVDVSRYTGKVDKKLPYGTDNPDEGTVDILGSKEPGSDTRSAVLAAIASATHSITLANQEIDDDDVIQALLNKKAFNPALVVNVLIGPRKVDGTYGGMVVSLPMNLHAIDAFLEAGINIFEASSRLARGGIMHAKVVIVDGTEVIAGSSDLNARSFYGNVELDLRIRSREVAAAFEKGVFEEIEQSKPVTPTNARERLVSSTVSTLRSAVIGFNRSRRLMQRMSVGLSAAGRRILKRQKLGIEGIQAETQPIIHVRDAKALLQAALDKNGTQASEARAIGKQYLRHGERMLFVGMPKDKAALAEKGAFPFAMNSNFGAGIYLGSDPHTAIDYAVVRSQQQGTDAGAVLVVAAKLRYVFELPAGNDAIAAWVKKQPGAPADPLKALPHYCKAHGFDAVVVHGAEGPDRDYVVVYDERRLRPLLRQDLEG